LTDGVKEQEIEPREFTMNRSYKRMLWYGVVAYLIATGVLAACWLSRAEGQPIFERTMVCVWVMIGAFLIACLLRAYRWRMCVDSIGIHRRGLRSWTVWYWEDLRLGRCSARSERSQKERKLQFLCGLNFHSLNEEGLQVVNNLYHKVLASLTEAHLPEKLDITLPYLMRPNVLIRFDEAGIHSVRGNACIMLWKDVTRVDVVREHHGDEDFREFTVKSDSGRFLRLEVCENDGWLVPGWRGARPEAVELFVRRHVTEDRFVEMALAGAPESLLDFDLRLKRLRSDGKWLAGMALVFCATILPMMFAEMAHFEGDVALDNIWDILRVGGLFVVLIIGGAFANWIARVIVTERKQLQTAREEMLSDTIEEPTTEQGD